LYFFIFYHLIVDLQRQRKVERNGKISGKRGEEAETLERMIAQKGGKRG